MKERGASSEQKTELEIKAEKFLDLLYKYDFVGKDAYFRKEDPGLFIERGRPLFNRDHYNVIVNRKYVWMDTPDLRLGITKDGDLFQPKKYWSFGNLMGAKIDDFLDPDLWGKNIYRIHTMARRGMGGAGGRYESAEFHYHNLHFRGLNKLKK